MNSKSLSVVCWAGVPKVTSLMPEWCCLSFSCLTHSTYFSPMSYVCICRNLAFSYQRNSEGVSPAGVGDDEGWKNGANRIAPTSVIQRQEISRSTFNTVENTRPSSYEALTKTLPDLRAFLAALSSAQSSSLSDRTSPFTPRTKRRIILTIRKNQ